MDKLTIQMIVIIIVLCVILFITLRYSKQKKLRDKLYKETTNKFDEVNKLYTQCEEALKRSKEICKTQDSIDLYNIWEKDYNGLEIEIKDLTSDYEELKTYYTKRKHVDYVETDKTLNYKTDALLEKVKKLHQVLFNFTSYEIENTKLALDLKDSLKEGQARFEKELAVKEVFDQSFESQCKKVEYEFNKFEDNQKIGDYTKARKHLHNASDLISIIETNIDTIVDIYKHCNVIDTKTNKIDEAVKYITEGEFKLDENEFILNYESEKEKKANIESELANLTFTKEIGDEFIALKEHEIKQITDNIDIVKGEIENQYINIKKISELIVVNDQLITQNDELVQGAISELEEINKMYQLPNNKSIQKLLSQTKTYEKFKVDYQVLLDIIYDLKEDYDNLTNRITQSNEFLNHYTVNIKVVIEELAHIRQDEIKALENIEGYKEQLTKLEFYLIHNEHKVIMSNKVSGILTDTYAKIEKLENTLETTPLDITEVRKLTNAVDGLLKQLATAAEAEIKMREIAKQLIKYCNRFVEDNKTVNIIKYATSLYNSHEYEKVNSELHNFLKHDFENGTELYNNLLKTVTFQTYANFCEEQ